MAIKNYYELLDRLREIVSTYHQECGYYADPLLTVEDLHRIPVVEVFQVAARINDSYGDDDLQDLLEGSPCDPDGDGCPVDGHEFVWYADVAEHRCKSCGLEPFGGLDDRDRGVMDTYRRGFKAGLDAMVALLPDEVRRSVADGEITLPLVANHPMYRRPLHPTPLWP